MNNPMQSLEEAKTLFADLRIALALACICDLLVPLCNLYHMENSERRLEGNRNLKGVNC